MLCVLWGGMHWCYVAQRGLGSWVSLCVVRIKGAECCRALEKPRRPPVVWGMDVSKQGFSASSCHMSNLLFAMVASKGRSSASQCSWYFIQYNVDNIIGVSMTILAHHVFIRIARLVSKKREV